MATAQAAARAARVHPLVNAPLAVPLRAMLRLARRDSPWLVKHLPRSGTVSVELPNGRRLRLRSRGDDWVSTQLFWRGLDGYEGSTIRLLFDLAQEAPVIVDVGAHVGYTALVAALANERGRVIALEPLPRTFQRLVENVGLNGTVNVECVNAGAGALPGSATLYSPRGDYPSAASFNREHLSESEVQSTTVPVMTIDELLAARGIERLGLLKIDAETTEAAVLTGARQTLARDRPHIICEVLDQATADGLTSLLEPLGYRFFQIESDGVRPRESIVARGRDVEASESNYLFSARERPPSAAVRRPDTAP